MKIPLQQSLETIINEQFKDISNPNLLFTKYVRGWQNDWGFESKDKGSFLERAIKVINDNNVNYDRTIYNKFLTRWQFLLNSIKAVQIKGKVHWRLIVGLGSGSVLETSMTLHHILGAPFIPGTALKGVVSSYYIEKNRENIESNMKEVNIKRKQENKKEKEYEPNELEEFAMNEDEQYIKLFGNEKQKGKVTFLDAYPAKVPRLEMDIMNPHYQKYYSGDKDNKNKPIPPADWLSPNPIKFVTVAKDAEFVFAFKTNENSLTEEIKTLIKETLENSGIGAKTSVGYGYFKNLENVETTQSSPVAISADAKKEETTPQKQELPKYLKNETELKDEYQKPDGTMRSEKEYQEYLKNKNIEYNKHRKQQFAKAKNWYEKNKVAK